MTPILAALLLMSAAPVEGTLAVLPAHSGGGGMLQGHDALVQAVAQGALDRGVGVIDVDVVRDVLVTLAGQGIRCEDAACFARVGRFAGADIVVVPLVEGHERRLLRVDVDTATLTLDVPVGDGDGSAAIAWVLDGRATPARLNVDGPSDAALWVDGVERATLPLATPLELEPGEHRVQLRVGERVSALRDVTLTAAEELTLALDLPPAPPSHAPSEPVDDDDEGDGTGSGEAPRLLLWTGAGVLGAGVGLAVLAGAIGGAGYSMRFLGTGVVPATGRFVGGLLGDAGVTIAILAAIGGVAVGGALLAVDGMSSE